VTYLAGHFSESTLAGLAIAKLDEHGLAVSLRGGHGQPSCDGGLADAALARDEDRRRESALATLEMSGGC
jgi:hypothetical protein